MTRVFFRSPSALPRFVRLVLCAASAFAVIGVHPPFSFSFLSVGALVPFFLCLKDRTPASGARWGFLWGFWVNLGLFFWFWHMKDSAGISPVDAALTVFLLSLYLACYPAFFGWGVLTWDRTLMSSSLLWAAPSFWVVLDWIRSTAFSGFGWAALGHGLAKHPLWIQIADVTGVYGVTFYLVGLNCFLFQLGTVWLEKKSIFPRQSFLFRGLSVAMVLGGVGIYGVLRHQEFLSRSSESVTIGVVQGNIAQTQKWDPRYRQEIISRYKRLTQELLARHAVDLIVWPETAWPDFWGKSLLEEGRLEVWVRQLKNPLILGAVHVDNGRYTNAALWLSPTGVSRPAYAKRHLVPFGEYLPFRETLPFLESIVPIKDFSSGTSPVIWEWIPPSGKRVMMGVLICFEDTVAPVVRESVRAGAHLLINITNDAWFLDSKEPWMHRDAAIVQAVGFRRALVRAANTGISTFIHPSGEIIASVQDEKGHVTWVEGFAAAEVPIENQMTFYTKYGDVFTLFCFTCILIGIGRRILGKRFVSQTRRTSFEAL